MPTNFLVHVRTLEPAPPLAEPGDTESPVINAITEALSNLGAELQSAEHGAPPRVFPFHYIVIVDTSEVSEEDFQSALQQSWPVGQDIEGEGETIPPADISVGNMDD